MRLVFPARRRLRRAAAAGACLGAVGTALAGCQFTGFGALPLPFTKGTGSGTYTVTAQLSDVTNLPANSEVMVHDVTVGTVKAITFSHWHANLTLSLPDRVKLPANATAVVGQKSLLGAEYVALAPPANAKPAGRLAGGDVIPLSRTSAYPSTEEVLAALSTVLNGGGLNQLSTITRELNDTLAGRTAQVRDLLASLSTLAGTLNRQRGSIVAATANLNHLAAQIKAQDSTLVSAVDTIPGGLAVLDHDEGDLATALRAVTKLSTVANQVIDGSRQNLLSNLRDLQPAVAGLADSGHNLISALNVLPSYPFPVPAVLKGVAGDYGNLFLTLDLTTPELEKAWLTGSAPSGSAPDTPASQTGNPLTAPVRTGSKPAAPASKGGSGGGLGGLLGGLTGGGG